jgi:hypothetical protein
MALTPEYLAALELLGRVCEKYRIKTGAPAYLVGGAAVAIMTAGAFPSFDFDLVVASDEEFEAILLAHGFKREDRPGWLRFGYYHPEHPAFGWQLVTGPLFDGRSDRTRAVRFEVTQDSAVIFPPAEDLIADRLGQFEANRVDPSRLEQAQELFQVAETIDMDYLSRRVAEEGGNTADLGEREPD